MGKTIGIDSSLFMYLWNRHPDYFSMCSQVFKEIESGQSRGVFAEVGLIEVLTGPKKDGKFALAAEYKNRVVNLPNLLIKSINNNIIETASNLRAKYNLRTPDAIHLATAIDAGANKFITNDKALIKVKEIKIQLLN